MPKLLHRLAVAGAGVLLLGLAWALYVEFGGPSGEYVARARACTLCHGSSWAEPMEALHAWQPGMPLSPLLVQRLQQVHPVLSAGAEDALAAWIYPQQLAALAELRQEHPGKALYEAKCATCHGKDGLGSPGNYPPLLGSEWISDEPSRLPDILTEGLRGPITVKGVPWDNTMRAPRLSSPDDMARLIDYLRATFK